MERAMIAAVSTVARRWAAVALVVAGAAAGQIRLQPPVPTWQPSMQSDPRYSEQYVFLSQDRTEIILRYRPEPDRPGPRLPDAPAEPEVFLRAKIRNRVAPALQVRVSSRPGGRYVYKYEVRNLPTARDHIAIWGIVAPEGIDRPPIHRSRWVGPSLGFGPPTAKQLLLPGAPPGHLMLCLPDGLANGLPIPPGGAESDLLLESEYRPGFTTAEFGDNASQIVDWPETDKPWSDAVSRQLDPLLRWVWFGKKYVTVGPVFRPDEPTAAIAERLKFAIERVAGINEIELASPLLSEARKALELLSSGGDPANASVHACASTDREKELAQILQLSLRVETCRSADHAVSPR
jgi:hypothetical protein